MSPHEIIVRNLNYINSASYNSTSEIMLPFVGKSRENTDGVKPCSAKASDTKLIFAAGNVFSM